MNAETKARAVQHALEQAPRESCGLVVIESGKERYFPCQNIAEKQSQFIMNPEDFARAEDMGDIVAIVHSHPNAPATPSEADRVGCELSGLPWFIVSLPSTLLERLDPAGYKAPLIGRPFVHGILDCYALIRDWYREARGIELKDFDRAEEWWAKGGNLYIDHFREAGFEPIGEGDAIQEGDVILMQIQSKVANHAAIYLGRDVMIHHLMNRLSCREIYGGYWKKNTRLVIRYRGIP